MDPVSIIVTALVSGMTIALNPTAEKAIKDAYAGLKALIQHKFAQVDISLLEADPSSKARQAVVQEDLEGVGAGQDKELLSKAQALLDAIQVQTPIAPNALGLDLEDIKAASLTAQRILAEGPHATGIKLKGVEIQDNITFSKVTARSGDDISLKKSVEATANESHPSGAVIFKDVSAGRDIHIGNTRSDLEELEEYLALAVSVYERDMFQAVFRKPMPAEPYKFLDSFGLEDAPIFFGREVATEELAQTVLRNRLTVLHAKSGAGKTSLLNAGLSPRFIREGRLPLYVDAYYRDEDPILAIKRKIASAKHGTWPRLLYALSLPQFLGLVCKHLSRITLEVVVILDQFEQFFILWSQPEARRSFIKDLSLCYNDQTLPLRFIIALRKDYYSDLAEFRRVAPSLRVLDEERQVSFLSMTEEEAQASMTTPLEKLGLSLTYEPALLKKLLADLNRGEIELPLLQIICTSLYKETHMTGVTEISLKVYEDLGGAEGVLGSYLKSQLVRFPEREETLARSILKELVYSDGTKQLLNYTMLSVRTQAQKDELDHVLNRLVDDLRLVRRYKGEGEARYTLIHEYLATEILTWMDVADQEFKRAEELLQREITNWRVNQFLIPKNRLEVLYPYRDQFKDMGAEAWRCLLISALTEDFEVVDWIKAAGTIGERVLFQVLKSEDTSIRQKGIKTLERLGDPRAVEPLITALKDEVPEVRRYAASALERLRDPRAVEPLITALKDADPEVRRYAASALGRLRDPRAVDPLITALKDADTSVRRYTAEALGQMGDPRAIEPLIAALKDADEMVRWHAASALERLGDPQAIGPLIAALKDADPGVRRYAASALGQLGDPRAVDPLITALKDADEMVRLQAASALGQLGDPQAVEPLIAVLKDADASVRRYTASALGQMGDPRAIEPLIAALKDADKMVRLWAASALERLGDPRAIESLTAALKDADPGVRLQAASALEEIRKF